MSSKANINISQNYEVIPPEKDRAYPIPVKEWEHIKKNIGSLNEDKNIYDTIGSLLAGAGISQLFVALTSDFSLTQQNTMSTKHVICWAIAFCAIFSGLVSFYFGRQQRKDKLKKISDVLDQMGLMEERYMKHRNE